MLESVEAAFCRGLSEAVVEGPCGMCGEEMRDKTAMKLSCDCFCCPICLAGILASSGGRCRPAAKRCGQMVGHYAAIKPKSANGRGTDTGRGRNTVEFVQVEPRIGRLCPLTHPFHHCIEEHTAELKSGARKIVLLGGVVEHDAATGDCGLSATDVVVLDEYQGVENNLTNDQTEAICAIFSLARMHIRETSLSSRPHGEDGVPILSVKEYFENAVVNVVDNGDPMVRVLMSISSPKASFGFGDKTQLRKNANYQRRFISFMAARDMLLPGVQPLQAMICDQLSLEPSPTVEFMNLLSALNLSASQSVLKRKSAQAAVDRVIDGKKLGQSDVGIIGFDNLAQHGKPEVDHYIAVYGKIVRESLTNRLCFDEYSRDTQRFDDVVERDESRARALTAVQDRDLELISGTVLGYQLLALMWAAKAGNIEELLRKAIDTGDFTGIDFDEVNFRYANPLEVAGVSHISDEWQYLTNNFEILLEEGAYDPETNATTVASDSATRDEGPPLYGEVGLVAHRPQPRWKQATITVETRDRYQRNGTHIENFVHGNLSNKNSPLLLMESVKRDLLDRRYKQPVDIRWNGEFELHDGDSSESEEEEEEMEEEDATDVEAGRTRAQRNKIVEEARVEKERKKRAKRRLRLETLPEHIGGVIMSDGQPAKATYDHLNRDYYEEGLFYDSVRVYFGPFHMQNNGFNRFTDLHGDNFEYFLSLVETPKGVEHVSRPKDPRRRERFNYLFLAARMTSKAHALRKKLGRKVSIDELIEHEIKRAMKYPLCAAMLLMERHVAMLIMLQDSEQLGPEGVEMFNSCNRLLLKIFATTHAPDYVQHCHEHSVFLEEASEAQKRFYSLFILPMQSTGGRWRWFDRFQEDVVMDYRSVLTKNLTRGQVAKFEQAAHRIEHRASARRYGGVASMRGNVRLQEQGPNDLTNHEKLFFAKTFVESIDLNLDHGDIDQPPRIRTKEGGFTDCDDRRLYNLNGVEGNAKLFDWDSISDEVIRSYSDLYYRDNLHSPSRSEKSGVTIPRLQGTVAERTAKFNKAVKVNTSTDINDFVKGQPPTVATMSDEIHRITRILDEKSIPNEERGYALHSEGAGHPVLAEKLAAARRVLFRVDVDERERRINNLRRQMMEQGCSTEEERRDKMSGPIFKMKREVLTKEQFKAKH